MAKTIEHVILDIQRELDAALSRSMTPRQRLAAELQAELDAAPNFKVGTAWWNDRIRALQGLVAR